jgi:small-conductance mechanosensitive channel
MDTQNLSAEEMDARLMQTTMKIREEALALDARNKEMAILVAQKEAIADRLETLWAELEQVNAALSALHPISVSSLSPKQ